MEGKANVEFFEIEYEKKIFNWKQRSKLKLYIDLQIYMETVQMKRNGFPQCEVTDQLLY